MPLDSQNSRRIAAPLAQRVRKDATADEIAAVMLKICEEINKALVPVVGTRGVAALHARSFQLTASRCAWMNGQRDSAAAGSSVEIFAALMAAREAGEAIASGDAYLQIFFDLFVSLTGPSLTERLLGSVWFPSSSGKTAQEISE